MDRNREVLQIFPQEDTTGCSHSSKKEEFSNPWEEWVFVCLGGEKIYHPKTCWERTKGLSAENTFHTWKRERKHKGRTWLPHGLF